MSYRFLFQTLALVLGLALAACNDVVPAVAGDAGPQSDAAIEQDDAGEEPADAGEDPTDAGEEPTDAGEEPTDGGEQQSVLCGGRIDRRCPTGEYCKFELEAMCGAFDEPGVCTPIPEAVCPPVVRAVCGCDGNTYSSDCDAAVAGVSVAAEGACVKPGCEAQDARGEGEETTSQGFAWNGTTCVELVGSTCEGDDCRDVFWSKAACLSHYLDAECYEPVVCGGRFGADCADDEFCDYPDGAMCGAFDLSGICWPRPVTRFCDVMNEQCGCDGETYANECYANAAGVDVMYPGPCAEPECRAQQARGDSSTETSLGWSFNGRDCGEQFGQCEGPDCDALFLTRAACISHYIELGCIEPQPCGTPATGECAEGEYCRFEIEDACGRTGEAGECTPLPLIRCPPEENKVCGCDGLTYHNPCEAEAAGVSVAAAGACIKDGCEAQDAQAQTDGDTRLGYLWNGTACVELVGGKCAGEDCDALFGSKAECLEHHVANGCYQLVSCGGRGGRACAEDEFCDFPDGAMCGAFDLSGVCWPRPDPRFCDLMNEQCGCDGNSYANECYANASGVDVMYPGPCAEAECRAQNARGDGSSEDSLGWAFDGYDCRQQFGQCEGPDCGSLFGARAACIEHYEAQGCIEPTPCSAAMSSCSPDDYCDYDEANVCGLTDGEGVCRPRPGMCNRILAPVCACDGRTYSNECEAAKEGLDVSAQGPCECQAQDVAPVGTCKAIIGYWWDGAACVVMEACACEGSDCVEVDGESRPPFTDEATCTEVMEGLGCTM